MSYEDGLGSLVTGTKEKEHNTSLEEWELEGGFDPKAAPRRALLLPVWMPTCFHIYPTAAFTSEVFKLYSFKQGFKEKVLSLGRKMI